MAASNALFILGMNSQGVVLGARQATQAVQQMGQQVANGTAIASKGARGLFNNMAQVSFGLQDIVTVLAMGGGVERALLSASNNFAFIASSAGTMKGAIAGVGIVLAATFGPSMVRWLFNARDMRKELEALTAASVRASNQRAGRAGRDVEFSQKIRDAGGGDLSRRATELATLVNNQRDAIERNAADQRSRRADLLQSVERASRLQERYAERLRGHWTDIFELSQGARERQTKNIVFGWEVGELSRLGQRAREAQEEVRQLTEARAEAFLVGEEEAANLRSAQEAYREATFALAAYYKERQRLYFGKDESKLEHGLASATRVLESAQRGLGLGGGGMFRAIRESDGAMLAMSQALRLQVDDAQTLRGVYEEIVGLMERQANLARSGTVDEANARQTARMRAFDAQAMENRQRDEDMRRLLQNLNMALQNGARIVVVR